VGQDCVIARPQVPLPVPALKTPHENALDDDRDARSIFTLTVKSRAISLIVNSDTRCARRHTRRDLKNHWRDVHMHGFGVDTSFRFATHCR
jgi:hypothetical protein